ncbi:hypothetical protein CDAR_498361 [Caerostris darwini]|uniref:Gustatory receptor n=1 Tax=Caerostris darwini TaxID=1538125 RepID=A0AAV4U021_9ARAC|nr:hypothetical protein CDAR_498361 [Caerostris darwini]
MNRTCQTCQRCNHYTAQHSRHTPHSTFQVTVTMKFSNIFCKKYEVNRLLVYSKRYNIEFLKSLDPIIFLFYLTGLEIVLPSSDLRRKNRLYIQLRRCVRCVCFGILVFPFFFQFFWFLALPEKKVEGALLFAFALQSTAWFSIRKHRRKLVRVLKQIGQISQMLQYNADFKRKKWMISLYCIFSYSLIIGYLSAYFYSVNRILDFEYLKQSILVTEFKISSTYMPMFRDIAICCYTLGNSIPVISITALYIYLAAHVKSLFDRITKRLRHLKDDSNFQQVLQAYRGLVNALNCMDDIFSYSVFILVLNSMVGLFRSTYSLVFLTKTCFKRNFYYCFSVLYYFIILTSVIVYASETIQAGRRCREQVISLPGMFPHRYLELKILIRKNFKGELF